MSNFSLPSRRTTYATDTPLRKALRSQVQVLWALVLHDIKSRFFGNGLGYIVTILWPTAHLVVILLIFVIGGRAVPYGNSKFLYASTGIVPYIAWNYMSRFTMLSMAMNKQFLAYPIIKPLDMMFARLALEHITVFIIVAGVLTVGSLLEVDIFPISVGDAILGLFSAVLLGIGFGILNTVIYMMFNLWFIGYVLILILFWLSAGLAINPETMPESIGYWLSWNPLLHSIEWVRLGYYPDFPAHLLSKSYVLEVGAGSFALGLMMERVCRRMW